MVARSRWFSSTKGSSGQGHSFTSAHTGTANTGAEPNVEFPLKGKNTSVTRAFETFLNAHNRLGVYATVNARKLRGELRDVNIVAASMLDSALSHGSWTDAGFMDASQAFSMRSQLGKELKSSFQKCVEAAKGIPFLELEFHYGKRITDFSLQDPCRPKISIQNLSTKVKETLRTSVTVLGTGTIWRSPLAGSPITQFVFSQEMNPRDLGSFLNRRGLLDANGKLKTGSKILCGGTSLSSIDQVYALAPSMDLFEACGGTETEPFPFRVTQSARNKYEGAITLISRTSGQFVPPRHTHSTDWTQATQGFATTDEFHALFLHDDPALMMDIAHEVIRASVARSQNVRPSDVDDRHLSTAHEVKFQYDESKRFRKAMLKAESARSEIDKDRYLRRATGTMFGAFRQASFSFQLGYGMETNRSNAIEQMEARAPLTFKNRHGRTRETAIAAAITKPTLAKSRSNIATYKKWLGINSVMIAL